MPEENDQIERLTQTVAMLDEDVRQMRIELRMFAEKSRQEQTADTVSAIPKKISAPAVSRTPDETDSIQTVKPACTGKKVRSAQDLKNLATNPDFDPKKPVTDPINGLVYDSVYSLSLAHGVSFKSLSYRLRADWDVEEALNPDGKKSSKPYAKHTRSGSAPRAEAHQGKSVYRGPVTDYEGRVFPSIKAMCAYHKIGYDCYQWRKRHHWDLKDALTLPPETRPDSKPAVQADEPKNETAKDKGQIDGQLDFIDMLGNTDKAEA